MQEANELFLYTQWAEMMGEFARSGRATTVVLPADFQQSRSMFEQMLAASAADEQAQSAQPVPPATGRHQSPEQR